MELITLHRRAVEQWAASVAAVKNDQWVDPTPCTEWSVRELVNHVVAEELWMAPLLRGATIQEVGHQFDGDVLGGDPLGRARMGADEAVSIVDAIVPEGGRVQLSYGEEDMGEYVRQLCADHLIHCWDLAAATGEDTSWTPSSLPRLAPGSSNERRCTAAPVPLVHALPVRVTRSRTFLRPSAGPRNGGPNHAVLARFSAAFGSGDVDGIMARMSDDCVFESTGPSPDGRRYEGQAAVRAVWEQFFSETKDPKFTDEDTFLSGDRACARWRFTWTSDDGSEGHVRGVDVIRFRDGLISEKLSYVKG